MNTYFDPADIPRTHELIVDAVTALLTHGGHPDDVDGLLRATMAHTRRRMAPEAHQDGPFIGEFISANLNKWRNELVVAWSKNKRPEAPAFEAQTVSDRIRVNARESLWLQFATFMDQTTPEEIRFLLEILHRRNDRAPGADEAGDEILLANSFEVQIQRDEVCYLKVPERLVKEGQKCIDAIRAMDADEDIENALAARVDILAEMAGLGNFECSQVRTFVKLVKANQSNAITPMEDFISGLPHLWEQLANRGRWLTPDDLIREIEDRGELRLLFEDGVKIARAFNERYPKVVAGTGSSEDEAA